MDPLSQTISLIYAIILILGGIMGYVKAQSMISLATGLISGVLVFISSKIGKSNPKASYLYISSISLILAGFFSYRYASTHAFMPAGLMLLLSTITFVVVGLNFLKSFKK